MQKSSKSLEGTNLFYKVIKLFDFGNANKNMEICVQCRCRLHDCIGYACRFVDDRCCLCTKTLLSLSHAESSNMLKLSTPVACGMTASQSSVLANFAATVTQKNSVRNTQTNEDDDDVKFILGSLRQLVKFITIEYNTSIYYNISIDKYTDVCFVLLQSSTNLSDWMDEDGNTFLHLICALQSNIYKKPDKYIKEVEKFIKNINFL